MFHWPQTKEKLTLLPATYRTRLSWPHTLLNMIFLLYLDIKLVQSSNISLSFHKMLFLVSISKSNTARWYAFSGHFNSHRHLHGHGVRVRGGALRLHRQTWKGTFRPLINHLGLQ